MRDLDTAALLEYTMAEMKQETYTHAEEPAQSGGKSYGPKAES